MDKDFLTAGCQNYFEGSEVKERNRYFVQHMYLLFFPFVHADRKNPACLSRLQILLSYTDIVLQFCFLSFYRICSSL